jgi:hypothetical protein
VQSDSRRFQWHPEYASKTVAEVRAAILGDLEADQRAYQLTMSAPDEQEAAILTRVLELERRWGVFDMDWYAADAASLADRIVEFEWQREERRALFPFNELLASGANACAGTPDTGLERPWWAFWSRR